MVSRRIPRCLAASLVAALLAAAGGCSEETATAESDIVSQKPHVLALSTYSASLGTPIDVLIANPPDATARKFELIFEGTFTRSDGKEEKVALVQPANRTEAGALRWTTFGPFANPFTPENPDIGVFKGRVGVKVTLEDGTEQLDDKPLPIQFEVKPSIMVTELQPVEARCGKPALRLIGGMSYKIQATTIGFKATSLEFAFRIPGTVPNLSGRPALDVDAKGQPKYRTTSLVLDPNIPAKESREAFSLPQVPQNIPNYGVVFVITAKDAEGRQIVSTFGMTAHRPLDLFYDGRYQLAQLYPPKPVSACMPGGQQGRTVSYSESESETRQRSLSITLSKSWLKSDQNNWSTSDGKTVSKATTNSDGYSNTKTTENSFSFSRNHSDTTGVSFTASSTNTKGLEGGVKFKPAGGILGEIGGGYRQSWSNTNATTNERSSTDGWSQTNSSSTANSTSTNHSTATTDSTAVTKTDTKGGSTADTKSDNKADQDAWTVSSTDTIHAGFSANVIANTYGVFYRQLARYTQKAFVTAYDMCGEGETIGEITAQDYVWAADLALSNECPPMPKSNFPEAQCQLPPCDALQ